MDGLKPEFEMLRGILWPSRVGLAVVIRLLSARWWDSCWADITDITGCCNWPTGWGMISPSWHIADTMADWKTKQALTYPGLNAISGWMISLWLCLMRLDGVTLKGPSVARIIFFMYQFHTWLTVGGYIALGKNNLEKEFRKCGWIKKTSSLLHHANGKEEGRGV